MEIESLISYKRCQFFNNMTINLDSLMKLLFKLFLICSIILSSLTPALGEAELLRTLRPGHKAPEFRGKSISSGKELSFTSNTGKPQILIFFSINPTFREERSIDLISKIKNILNEEFVDQVDLNLIFSDDKKVQSIKQYIADGLVPDKVFDDKKNDIYNLYGVYMMPTVVLIDKKGLIHLALPTNVNTSDIVQKNLKLLTGAWSEEEFKSSFNFKLSKVWTQEEKEYIRRVNYGRIMADKKMYSPAIREFTTAMKIMPDAIEAYIGLGYARLATKQYTQAEEAFRFVLKKDAESTDALAGLGITLYRKGEPEKALPILEDSIITTNQNLEAIISLAEIYESKGDFVKSMRLNKLAISKLRDKFN